MQLQTAAGVCRWVDTALYYSYACTAKYSAIYNIHASAKKFSVKQVQWWGLSAYMRRVHLLFTLSLLLLLHWLLLLLLLYIAVQCSVKQLQRIHAARALVIECPASLQCIPHANNPPDIHFHPQSCICVFAYLCICAFVYLCICVCQAAVGFESVHLLLGVLSCISGWSASSIQIIPT